MKKPRGYENYPITIGEIRSEKSNDAGAWSPRECLINVLRDIDDGKTNPSNLIVVWCDNGKNDIRVRRSTTDSITYHGMIGLALRD